MLRNLKSPSLALILFLTACGGKQNPSVHADKDTVVQSKDNSGGDTTHVKYNHLISNIPIPFDILNKLSNSYITYKAEFLNPVESAVRYNQISSRSLNLGIYGADLTYIISLGEFKEFAPHIRIIKKMADDLGIPNAFNDDMMARYNNNTENKDTLQKIIFHSYKEIDKTLKSNDRLGMAALVVGGGWIESLFLTTQTIGDHPNDGSYSTLYSLVKDQKVHLNNLIDLMDDFKLDPFDGIVTELKGVQKIYAEAGEGKSLSQVTVKSIAEHIAKLRNRIIVGN
jgi:hypothetical protein